MVFKETIEVYERIILLFLRNKKDTENAKLKWILRKNFC